MSLVARGKGQENLFEPRLLGRSYKPSSTSYPGNSGSTYTVFCPV